MWNIEYVDHEDRNLIHYVLSNAQHSFRIYTNLGCSLQQMKVHGVEIIDGISNDPSGLEDYRKTFKSSVLFPFPNRIDEGKYSFDGNSYALNCNDPLNNAIHGLLYDRAFALIDKKADHEMARMEFKYSSDGQLTGYPFLFDLFLCYSFDNSGDLKIEFTIHNTGKSDLPFGMGWHPYFRVKDLNSTVINMPVEDTFEVTEKMIPIEREAASLESKFTVSNLKFDDAYTLKKGICALETENYVLEMEFDKTAEAYLQVYTPPHRRSIALEPMTCLANAFNNGIGLEMLSPGDSFNWNIRLNCQIKP